MHKFGVLGNVLYVCCAVCSPVLHARNNPDTLCQVSAAASLRDALNSVAKNAQQEPSPAKIKFSFNFSGSQILAKQIKEGAPADIFFSADRTSFELLSSHKTPIATAALLENTLAVVAHQKSEQAFDFHSIKKLAVGHPGSPIGKYTEEYLRRTHILPQIQKRLVYQPHVRAVAALVLNGAVEAGIVYSTDAMVYQKQLKTVYQIPPSQHTKITYWIGQFSQSKDAQSCYELLTSRKSLSIYQSFGFKVHGS